MVEVDYWDHRYRTGGTSGRGSVGRERGWKWRLVKRYARVVDDVLDVGCGDLSFWEGQDCPEYLGLDLSPHVQGENARRRPRWRFEVCDATRQPIHHRKRIVFCFDVLFHVMEEPGFRYLLENLASSTGEWLFLTNFAYNALPGGRATDGLYQSYRDLEDYAGLLQPLTRVASHEHGEKVFYAFYRS